MIQPRLLDTEQTGNIDDDHKKLEHVKQIAAATSKTAVATAADIANRCSRSVAAEPASVQCFADCVSISVARKAIDHTDGKNREDKEKTVEADHATKEDRWLHLSGNLEKIANFFFHSILFADVSSSSA